MIHRPAPANRRPAPFVMLLGLMLGVTLAVPGTANATAAIQNLNALTSAARHWLATTLPHDGRRRIVIQRPDPRLRLPACRQVSFSRLSPSVDSGRIAIRARCDTPAWQLYLAARVAISVAVVVANGPLEAGTHLTKKDLLRVRRPLSSLPPNAVGTLSAAVGHILKYGLATGSPITVAVLTLPAVIHVGDHLTIVASGDGISLSTIGIAMQNGRPGQTILVRNLSSGRVLSATVMAAHKVIVTF